MTISNITLGEFLVQQQAGAPGASGEFSALFAALVLAAKAVHRDINRAGLVDVLGAAGETNVQGEPQQKLDVLANTLFSSALAARGVVCGIASEEEEGFIRFEQSHNQQAKYVVLMDPLDGSANIDVNVSVGTIFSVVQRVTPVGGPVNESDFLQPGTKQVAAGYVIYGTSTLLVYSTGKGVNGFTYDASLGEFCLSHPNMQLPKRGSIYSVNQGNFEQFPRPVQRYLMDCQTENAAKGQPYSARYIGSLVSDFHRNLIKGGVYLYPPVKAFPEGKLRLLYECNPIAFIAEQAGGKAIIAPGQRVLEVVPTSLHQRCPFYVGSYEMVEQLESSWNTVD